MVWQIIYLGYMDMKKNSSIHHLRLGEQKHSHTRSERFFQQEAYWYFRTREGFDIGPFDRQIDAETGLNGFIGFLQQAHEDVVTKITTYIKLQTRKDETLDVPKRSDRLFSQDNYWYFRTREGMDIGPFDNRGDAAVGAKSFIGFLEGSQPEIVSRVTSYIKAVA
jgi:chromatin remodeling complex protein RSC6